MFPTLRSVILLSLFLFTACSEDPVNESEEEEMRGFGKGTITFSDGHTGTFNGVFDQLRQGEDLPIRSPTITLLFSSHAETGVLEETAAGILRYVRFFPPDGASYDYMRIDYSPRDGTRFRSYQDVSVSFDSSAPGEENRDLNASFYSGISGSTSSDYSQAVGTDYGPYSGSINIFGDSLSLFISGIILHPATGDIEKEYTIEYEGLIMP